MAPPPIWLMRQAGRYLPEYRALRRQARNFLAFCYTPDLAAQATLQPIERYAMDAAILFCDILVIPDALGQEVAFVEGEGPVLEPIRSADGVGRLRGIKVRDRLSPVYAAVAEAKRRLPDSVAMLGFAGAPWTVAVYMVEGRGGSDFSTVKKWAFADGDGFGSLIDILVAATTEHLLAQVEAGAEAVQLFDSWAGVLPAGAFERWCIAPTRAIVDGVRHVHPRLPIIGFPRGAGVLLAKYVRDTGVDAVSLDFAVPPAWAADSLPQHVAIQGNLDPAMLLAGGHAMGEAARGILGAFRGRPHIFNLGHGVLQKTPPEHVAELVRLVRNEAAR